MMIGEADPVKENKEPKNDSEHESNQSKKRTWDDYIGEMESWVQELQDYADTVSQDAKKDEPTKQSQPETKKRKENPVPRPQPSLQEALSTKLQINPFLQKPPNIDQEVWESLPPDIQQELCNEHK